MSHSMSFERYLPPHLDRSQLAAAIGLVSDTHMPYRRRTLPTNLADVLGGVDLLLHAGDVGELWVLDQLSAIAPVIAVHGNDDSADAQRELPYQQVITVAGERILLWHSHFPDWKEEMASRVHNNLRLAIQRSVDRPKVPMQKPLSLVTGISRSSLKATTSSSSIRVRSPLATNFHACCATRSRCF